MNFAAAFRGRQNFPGIQQALGIEDSRTRRIRSRSASLKSSGIRRSFSMPTPCSPVIEPPTSMQNSMISSAAATALRSCSRVARVEENDGVQVAVARVKNVADLESVFFADLADAAQRGGQFRPRDHAVLRVVSGRKAADRAERVLAALPQQIALARIAGHAHFARAMQRGKRPPPPRLRFGRLAQAIDFDQQHGGAIERKSRRGRSPRPRESSSHPSFRTPPA